MSGAFAAALPQTQPTTQTHDWCDWRGNWRGSWRGDWRDCCDRWSHRHDRDWCWNHDHWRDHGNWRGGDGRFDDHRNDHRNWWNDRGGRGDWAWWW
ncbi:hypothetical protein HYE82_14815 [Streptomyces sp. BR123]|uniref:hypothetical protein n=1 Tax=Streptomyces sp. BR123 TaxID=2749828 RepID=UPI0015C4105C|nr:hypothetical protein [Streptomyces sp. BR123]NXY95639.1 hypothetical protein [Streptomyces sp. BR123]